jgi:methylated-DNA-[protein]-cysteine S-methyltransferase
MEYGMNDENDYVQYLPTPVGILAIQANECSLLKVEFREHEPLRTNPNKVTRLAHEQLSEYMAGKRLTFELPLGASGTTFQQEVWRTLCTIPYGQTCSYQDIARILNNPKAVRAVGAANGKNPLAIVVPCHRVIGANGSLTGYAGGLVRKSWLLELESRQLSLV